MITSTYWTAKSTASVSEKECVWEAPANVPAACVWPWPPPVSSVKNLFAPLELPVFLVPADWLLPVPN